MDWLIGSFPINIITLVSLLVNSVTIYRWISENRGQRRVNDQAFHMIYGLALAATKRSSMVVQRIRSLQEQGQANDQAMIFLENMWSDTKSSIESMLATAKALKPDEAKDLPFDGDALLARSMIEVNRLKHQGANMETLSQSRQARKDSVDQREG